MGVHDKEIEVVVGILAERTGAVVAEAVLDGVEVPAVVVALT